ncbi:MAG: hypothetical protein NZM35_10235 [Chitinophagales bacterium]|nr:hypothetical protein [Chitinophagales bacterium]MDW8419711.1 hypothetical protein [Chitinophagales bacterium]
MRLIIWLLLMPCTALANMASPYFWGTHSAAPFSSRLIQIEKEILRIKLSSDFLQAHYDVAYHIISDTSGVVVPLLFYAQDYDSGFQVSFNNKPVMLQNYPYKNAADFLFGDDITYAEDSEQRLVKIYWDKEDFNYYRLGELKYFEVHLQKGRHVIRVNYTANAFIDRSGWINRYTHRYSLSPARHWKGLDSLFVEISTAGFTDTFSTNIHLKKQSDNTLSAGYSQLPAEALLITYAPTPSGFAKLMIGVGPWGITILTMLFTAILFYICIRKLRNYSPAISKIAKISGVLILPMVVVSSYILSFPLIYTIIGEHASRYHDYNFLAIFAYPVLALLYTLIWRIAR